MARPLELRPTTPVAVALSGGADSVFLTHLVARSRPRPKVLAIHVDHGLRGDESRLDAEFCARLCARLGVPFARRIVELGESDANLEARAREARYRALAEETSSAGIDVLLTGHHEDDAVETLLMRWMRGTDLSGLAGLRRETVLGTGHESAPGASRKLRVLRPLVAMRREEVRSALRREGLEWREDSSNATDRFTRGRVRHEVLPEIEAQCGERGVENFFEFARAIESFEDEIADRTAHIHWEPVAFEAARRSESMPDLGGRVPCESLRELSTPFLRRALGRLIGEGTGKRPGRDTLDEIAADISEGRSGRRQLHKGWSVQIQADAMHLNPPAGSLDVDPGGGGVATATPKTAAKPSVRSRTTPEEVAEDSHASPGSPGLSTRRRNTLGEGIVLGIPGTVQLPDGRSIHATIAEEGAEIDASATTVMIDARGLSELRVRFERPGDRVHPLGAPGHKPLRRFLGEVGIPREERGQVPVVANGDEIVWVAGVRISESRKVDDSTSRRVRLTLNR